MAQCARRRSLLGEIPATYPHYLTLARYFTADEINRDNVVLIGGKKSVPVGLSFRRSTELRYRLRLPSGPADRAQPQSQSGEQAVYSVSLASNSLVGYSVIAYLPNPSHTGNMIILAGTDSDATGAAAAFLTSENQMEKLRSTFHVDRFPYFEVLLKTSRLSGTFFDADLVAYRTYPNLH